MRASLARRILGFLGLVVAIGSAAIFAYRVNAEPPFPQPILGVVHQTDTKSRPRSAAAWRQFG